jgi:hypothetical protein
VREYIVRASLDGYRTGCKLCVGAAGGDAWCSVFLAPGEGAQSCTPPPRTLDVGPWPEAMDAGVVPDAGADAGRGGGGVGGCRAAGAEANATWGIALGIVTWIRGRGWFRGRSRRRRR